MTTRKGLIGWTIFGVYCAAKVATFHEGVAPSHVTPSTFPDYERYVAQIAPRATPATFSVPTTSESASYVLGLPDVMLPEIPRASETTYFTTTKYAGTRGTLTKSSRSSRTTQTSMTKARDHVVSSRPSRHARAMLNYGVNGYASFK